MAIRRTKPAARTVRTVTPDQELAYTICSSFYGINGCACQQGSHDTVCDASARAARRVKFFLTTMPAGIEMAAALTSHKDGSHE